MRGRIARAEQVAANDERLMRAARAVFVRRGYHAASLDQVADAAGLTKGAVYARFASKADLMLALLDRELGARAASIAAAVADVAASPSAVAAALGAQWTERAESERGWSLLLLEFRVHAARDRRLNARYAALHARTRSAIAAAIERGGAPATITSEDAARVALAVGIGFALERWVEGEAFPPELYARVNQALVDGLLAAPARRVGDAADRRGKAAPRRGSRVRALS